MFKRTSKLAYEMLVPTIKKNLTRRRTEFDKTVKGVDEALKGLSPEQKVTVRNKGTMKKTVEKISKIIDEGEKKGLDLSVKKAKGGRVGLKLGTRKSKAKKKFPDMSGDGKITKKDILIAKGVIPKPKKRII